MWLAAGRRSKGCHPLHAEAERNLTATILSRLHGFVLSTERSRPTHVDLACSSHRAVGCRSSRRLRLQQALRNSVGRRERTLALDDRRRHLSHPGLPEATTGWRFIVEELVAADATAHPRARSGALTRGGKVGPARRIRECLSGRPGLCRGRGRRGAGRAHGSRARSRGGRRVWRSGRRHHRGVRRWSRP